MPKKARRTMRTDDEKRELIRGYEAAEDKPAFTREHGLYAGAIYKWRKALGDEPAEALPASPAAQPGTDFGDLPRDEKVALAKEYRRLRPGQEKRAWREAHGAQGKRRRQLLYYYMKYADAADSRGRPPKTAPDLKDVLVKDIAVQPQSNGHGSVTLDDGINVLRVQRDHLNQTIDMLERLKAGVLASRR